MISEAELRRWAARWKVDPMVVDLDYSLGWFITALYETNDLAEDLCFKGGTCLRKCYFGDYRFSEDLDFTATAWLDSDRLLKWTEQAILWAEESDGPNYRAAPPRIEVVNDVCGDETYQIRVYYRGPLQWGGSPRAIRVDVTRDERMTLPCTSRHVIHPYSDKPTLAETNITCYTLVEILAEKIRAVGGQRRFAISRDLYDIHQLIESGVNTDDVIPLLPTKFEARGIDIGALTPEILLSRRSDFESDWDQRLSYLVHIPEEDSFEDAWETVVDVLQRVKRAL